MADVFLLPRQGLMRLREVLDQYDPRSNGHFACRAIAKILESCGLQLVPIPTMSPAPAKPLPPVILPGFDASGRIARVVRCMSCGELLEGVPGENWRFNAGRWEHRCNVWIGHSPADDLGPIPGIDPAPAPASDAAPAPASDAAPAPGPGPDPEIEREKRREFAREVLAIDLGDDLTLGEFLRELDRQIRNLQSGKDSL